MIMVDHGIREQLQFSEVDAFIAIGNHLFDKGINIPRIYAHDAFSGLVCLEDLGDRHLLDVIQNTQDRKTLFTLYGQVIDLLVEMSQKGLNDFRASYTYQTDLYSKELILEKECRYFIDAFLRTYLKRDVFFARWL